MPVIIIAMQIQKLICNQLRLNNQYCRGKCDEHRLINSWMGYDEFYKFVLAPNVGVKHYNLHYKNNEKDNRIVRVIRIAKMPTAYGKKDFSQNP